MDNHGSKLLPFKTISSNAGSIFAGFIILLLIAQVNALYCALTLLAELSEEQEIVDKVRFLPSAVLLLFIPVLALIGVGRKGRAVSRFVILTLICMLAAVHVWAVRGGILTLVAFLVEPQLLLIGNFSAKHQIGIDAITLLIPIVPIEIACYIKRKWKTIWKNTDEETV